MVCEGLPLEKWTSALDTAEGSFTEAWTMAMGSGGAVL